MHVSYDLEYPRTESQPFHFTTFENQPYLMSRVDPDIRPLVAAWNRLSFSRTVYSCSGHYAKKRQSAPYVYFVVDPTAPQTPKFVYDIPNFFLHSKDIFGDYFVLQTPCASSFDHSRLLSYSLFARQDFGGVRLTRSVVKKLRTYLWPGLLEIVQRYTVPVVRAERIRAAEARLEVTAMICAPTYRSSARESLT